MMDGNFNETDASIFFKQALDAHSAGNLISAKKLYQATLALQPDHSEANHNIGVVHVVEKEFNTALEFFKLALNTSPNVSLFWVLSN